MQEQPEVGAEQDPGGSMMRVTAARMSVIMPTGQWLGYTPIKAGAPLRHGSARERRNDERRVFSVC